MSDGIHRKLAAIVSADVVGYSRLMGEDEAGTLAALRQWRAELFEPAVSSNNGKIVKNMGDGWLVEFDSAGDAVTCAIEVQEKLSNHEILKLRIGLHIGDVNQADNDIYGDGVNIAARLQEIAEPGAIVISDMAWRSVDGKQSAAFANLGDQDLKNIARPVAAYGWRMTEVIAEAAALQLPDKPSIAVLPFDNMSDDPEQEYLSDGITEDIITALSKFHWFFVIARNSTFTYKGKAVDIKQVGRELGVRYVLEGSVRKAGTRVRVAAQLIEAESGHHIWAERFDRDLNDIFEMQDEITLTIATAIEPELAASEQRRAVWKPTSDLKAWELVRRGAAKISQNNRESLLAASELFKQAIALDPNFCQAHGYLAFSTHRLVHLGLVADREVAIRLGIDHASTAIALDRGDYLAHASMGWLLLLQGNHAGGIVELEMSVDINPSYSGVNIALAHAMLAIGDYRGLGQLDEAIVTFESASRSPASAHFVFLGLAVSYVEAGRLEEAATPLQRARDIEPRLSISYVKENLGLDTYVESLRKAGLPE